MDRNIVRHRTEIAESRAKDSRQPWLRNLPVGHEHTALLTKIVEARDSIGGQALKLLAPIKGVSFKPELLDLLEVYAGDFNFSVNGIAPVLSHMLDLDDIPRLLRIAEKWQSNGDENSCYAIGDILGHYEPKSLIAAFAIPIHEMRPETASLLGEALSNRSDDEAFSIQSQLLLAFPNETTSSFSLAMLNHSDGEHTVRYRCLDHRHVEAIWSARFSQELWESALSAVCVARPDLATHVDQMAEAHTGIEAIALRYCAGAEGKVLLPVLEELLERDDDLLLGEPFAFFPMRELDWCGRELLFARSLGRSLPALRKGLLRDPFGTPPMQRGVLDLASLQPIIKIVSSPKTDRDSWWEQHSLGGVVAQLGNAEVETYCLASLVNGPGWLRDWVKRHYIHQAEGLTTDAMDDEMIAVLLADLNIPDQISQHSYNPLGHIATNRLVAERLLPLAEGASADFRKNLALVLEHAGNRHGKRYKMPS